MSLPTEPRPGPSPRLAAPGSSAGAPTATALAATSPTGAPGPVAGPSAQSSVPVPRANSARLISVALCSTVR